MNQANVEYQEQDIINLLYSGVNPFLLYQESPIFNKFLKTLDFFSIDYGNDIKMDKEWLTPFPYSEVDIKQVLLQRVNSPEEKERFQQEWTYIEYYKLHDLLKHLNYLVETMRENDIVWGVGRGSACASYILYLIGVHRVNPIKYDIDCLEFFKE